MMSPMRPTGNQPTTSYRAPAQAPVGGAAITPQPYVQPYAQPGQVQATGLGDMLNGLFGFIGRVFTSIVDFFKRLFAGGAAGGQTAPGVTPQAPGQVLPGQVPAQQLPAGPLTAEQAQIAQAQNLLATPANLALFMGEATRLEQTNALGPGTTNAAAAAELQTVLKGWGFPVNVTGQFDQATVEAVLKFKRDNNLFASYQLADGSRGLHPFIDEATKAAMIAKLQVQPVAPGVASVPVAPMPSPIVPGVANQPLPAPALPPMAPPMAPPPPPPPPPAPPMAAPPPVAPPPPPPPPPMAPPVAPPVAPVPTPAPAAGALTAEEQQIAQQQGIEASRANMDAFLSEAQAIEAAKAIGPGSADANSVKELQTLLSSWGYPLQANGAFDQATIDAVLKFKRDNNLPATYKLANGTPAFHPFIDAATKAFMIKKLEGAAPAVAAVPAPVPAPVAAPAVAQYQAPSAGALTAEETTVAQQQGIEASRPNFTAFIAEAQSLEKTNALGPGSTNTVATTELQTVLKNWGYTVNVNGQFDQTTIDATLKFKRDNNLVSTYKLANGTPAVHPFIDEATKAFMIKKLGG